MRLIAILAIIFLQMFSFSQASEMRYTHVHQQDVTDEEMNDHGDHHGASDSSEGKPHTHEVLIGSSAPFIQTESNLQVLPSENLMIYSDFEPSFPSTPDLFGIFRPPIFV